MADHLDAPGLQSPNMDARVDITDIYIFQKPGDPKKSIVVLNVNPLAPTLATTFDENAVYEMKIDTNSDAVAEVAFRIRFSKPEHGQQKATVRRASGEAAAGESDGGETIFENVQCSFTGDAKIATSGDYKFFVGIRSDPFFFDLQAFLNGFAFHNPGDDFFIDKNVFSMVLEVPNSALGSNPKIGYWARVLVRANDAWVQKDRMGRPAINTVFNHGQDKVTFNSIFPTQDRAKFEASFVATLASFGYDNATATSIAEILLPDILTYDYSSGAGFLNGRNLTDDVIDIELNLVTKGALTSDFVGKHADLLSVFPYLGHPH